MVTPGTPPVPHVGGPVLPTGEPTVLIGFMPAARVTDKCLCVGPPDPIAKGSPTVHIGKLMAARLGDLTMHGGVITVGCPTVLIGDVGMHNVQQQDFSCVIASSRNMIMMLTGKDIPESQLRDEMRVIMKDPTHDFNLNGIDPKFAKELLAKHGVKNDSQVVTNNDDLKKLTDAGKPVLVGFPGHRVMLESVKTDKDGNKTFIVRDPDPASKGEPTEMTEAQFNAKHNKSAIVIVPK
ncbi:MAG: PAAR domain-containing protein [Pirellulales bacterium]